MKVKTTFSILQKYAIFNTISFVRPITNIFSRTPDQKKNSPVFWKEKIALTGKLVVHLRLINYILF